MRSRADLGAVKNAKDDDFVFLGVELVHDDVGEAGDRAFKCVWGGSDMTYFGKFTKAIAISKNAVNDMRGCAGVLCLNVKVNRGDVIKRFEREAQLHIRARFLVRSTS
jgi:hypothetical protein